MDGLVIQIITGRLQYFLIQKNHSKLEVRKIKKFSNSIQIDFINDNLKTINPGNFTVKSYVFAGAKEVPLIDELH